MIEFLKTQFGFSILIMVILFSIIMLCVAYCILLERKIAAWIQDRIGPNRAGPRGLLQPIADGVKMFLKEDITSDNVDRPIFILAPAMAFVVALIGFAVIPWGGRLTFSTGETVLVQVASVDIGLLYILAIGSMGVYGVVLGGWASNNKFSLYGGMRAAAQMLSYEIPMGLAILVVVMTSGEFRLENIVAGQIGSSWNVLLHPLAFLILLTTMFAETFRTPFDLAEAEQELIAGYSTEYSSMKMALYFLSEYAHMITAGAFITMLFFGGWELFPFSDRLGWGWLTWFNHAETIPAVLCRFGIVSTKIGLFVFLYMWVRWTLLRLRFDQLMRIAWHGLVPISLGLVVLTGILVYIGKPTSIWATVGNVIVLIIVLIVLTVLNPVVTGRQEDMTPI